MSVVIRRLRESRNCDPTVFFSDFLPGGPLRDPPGAGGTGTLPRGLREPPTSSGPLLLDARNGHHPVSE